MVHFLGTRLALLLLLAGPAACAGAGPRTVVEPRELDQADSAPRILAVEDLGGIDIPAIGQVRPHASDGIAVIGETLCIRGRQFGRLPTVAVGGRVAAAVSRTGDGGILVRVPVGTPVGSQRVTVSQEHGTADFPLEVRRLGALHVADQLVWLELGNDGPRVRGSSTVPGARHLQVSADARAAYVLDRSGALTSFELAAPGIPAVAGVLVLGAAPARALLAASTAHRLLVLRQRDLVVLDTSTPLRPTNLEAKPLPAWLRGPKVVPAALSPDGRLLALGFPERNRLSVIAVDQVATEARAIADLVLVTETRAPLLVDLAFSPDGATLWALTGSNEANRALGPLPTTVHALRLAGGQGADFRLEKARAVVIEAAAFPVAISTGRRLALGSGAAIRLPPEAATVYVAARTRAGGRPALFAIGADDNATALFTEDRVAHLGRPDITPDGRWLVGPMMEGAGAIRLAAAPADGRPGATVSLVVGTGAPPAGMADTPDTLPPLAQVRLQP
jgi:hypothetical protein